VERVLGQLSSQARGSVALIGERRIGKTSLLHYVSAPDVMKRWNLSQERSIFIVQDCGSVAPLTITRFWQTILTRLLRLLGRQYPDLPLLASVQALVSAPHITTLDIEFLLDDLHDAGLILVLILDEFEWLIRTDPEHEAITRDLLAGLRALINHFPRALSIIVATRQPLDAVCRNVRFMGSPFYNNFVFVHLRPFSLAEAELFFEQMLAGTGVTFTPGEKECIYSLSGNHPLLLQIAAGLAFDQKVKGAGHIDDLAAIRDQFSDLVQHQFEDFWKWSQARERRILIQLASGEDEGQKHLEAWAGERETLLRRGLITLDESGLYLIFSSVFWQWLIANRYRLEEIHPPASPEMHHLEQQLEAHRRLLAVLEMQEARHGKGYAPPHLVMQIEDTQAEIELLEAKLAGA
jgi:hypothetical protein